MKTNKIYNFTLSAVHIIFTCMITSLLLLLVLAEPNVTYWYKREFLFDNYLLVLLGAAFIGIGFYPAGKLKGKPACKICHKKAFLVVSLIFFLIQLFVALHIYFLAGWDVIYVVQNAKWLAEGNLAELSNKYFSMYNNNLLLVFLCSKLFRAGQFFSLTEMKDMMAVFVVIQCIISSGTGVLLFHCVDKLFHRKSLAWLSWILYAALVLTSPWVVVPYSDSAGLFIPLCIFYLYISMNEDKYDVLRWVFITLLSYWGFRIKPQVLIITIAILAIEVVHKIAVKPTKLGIQSVLACGCVLVVSQLCFGAMINSMSFTLDKEKNFGVTHFLMMGLNTKSDGGYLDKDVQFSKSFATIEERKAGNVEKIQKRVDNLNEKGWGMHLIKKTLVNYGDGSFSFGQEGNFNLETYNQSDRAKFFQQIFYEEGKYFPILTTFQQGIWLLILICLFLAAVFYEKRSLLQSKEIAVLMLAIIGLSIFELMFEARSRYFYIYAPVYILLAVCGIGSVRGRKREEKN